MSAREVLSTRISVIDNVAFALIGLASVAIATFAGQGHTMYAGLVYFAIGPMKWALGVYSTRQHERLNTEDISPV